MAGKVPGPRVQLGGYVRLAAGIGVGAVMFLMVAFPHSLIATGAALGVNAALLHLIPGYQPPSPPPGAGQLPGG